MELIEEIQEDTSEYLEEWGLDEQFSVAQYRKNLKGLMTEVKKVMEIPKEKKTFEEW